MSITLDLPQELESELAAEATQLGLSLTGYALHLLVTRTRTGHMPTTGAELVLIGNAKVSLVHGLKSLIAKCMPVRYATEQKDEYRDSQHRVSSRY